MISWGENFIQHDRRQKQVECRLGERQEGVRAYNSLGSRFARGRPQPTLATARQVAALPSISLSLVAPFTYRAACPLERMPDAAAFRSQGIQSNLNLSALSEVAILADDSAFPLDLEAAHHFLGGSDSR